MILCQPKRISYFHLLRATGRMHRQIAMDTGVVEADDAVEKLKSLENIIRNLKSPRNPGVNSLDLFFFI